MGDDGGMVEEHGGDASGVGLEGVAAGHEDWRGEEGLARRGRRGGKERGGTDGQT